MTSLTVGGAAPTTMRRQVEGDTTAPAGTQGAATTAAAEDSTAAQARVQASPLTDGFAPSGRPPVAAPILPGAMPLGRPAARAVPNPELSPGELRAAKKTELHRQADELKERLVQLSSQASALPATEVGRQVQEVGAKLSQVQAQLAALPKLDDKPRAILDTPGGQAARSLMGSIDARNLEASKGADRKAWATSTDPVVSKAAVLKQAQEAAAKLSPHDRLDFYDALTAGQRATGTGAPFGSALGAAFDLGISKEVHEAERALRRSIAEQHFGDPAKREALFRQHFPESAVDAGKAAEQQAPQRGRRDTGLLVGPAIMGPNGVLTSHIQSVTDPLAKAGIQAEGWVTYNRDGTVDFTKWDPKYPNGTSPRAQYGIWRLETEAG